MFDWLSGDANVHELIQRGRFGKAVRLLRREFEGGRRDPELRLLLADVLAQDRRGKEAVPIYVGLADELARSGQGAKAIAVLKKIDRLEPGRADVSGRLAALVGDHGAAAAEVEDLRDASTPVPVETVAPSPLFGDFSREELVEVIRGLRLVTFEAGDIIVAEGEPGGSLFVISTGRVKAFVKDASGHCVEVRTMGEGDFFGEISVLSGRPRSATLTAAAHCELLELDRAALKDVSAGHPGILDVLRRVAGERTLGSAPSPHP